MMKEQFASLFADDKTIMEEIKTEEDCKKNLDRIDELSQDRNEIEGEKNGKE